MGKKLRNKVHLELNDAYQKTLYWFFSYPNDETSLSDLSTNLNISKTTANRVVNDLANEGFLKIKVLGKVWRISCNLNHPYNYSRKIAYNLSLVYEAQITSIVKEIVKNPKSTILFGSYRKGDDTEESDIDIAVEVSGNEDVRIEKLAVFPELGFRKNVQVNFYIFSRNKVDLNLFANISNGIVLDGFLEVKP